MRVPTHAHTGSAGIDSFDAYAARRARMIGDVMKSQPKTRNNPSNRGLSIVRRAIAGKSVAKRVPFSFVLCMVAVGRSIGERGSHRARPQQPVIGQVVANENVRVASERRRVVLPLAGQLERVKRCIALAFSARRSVFCVSLAYRPPKAAFSTAAGVRTPLLRVTRCCSG